MTYSTTGVAAYRSEEAQAAAFADSHALVSMLLNGAVERVVQARVAMERDMTARKGERIGKAIAIIDSLRASLDTEQGGDVAANLFSLYAYMLERLLHANLHDDSEALNEVAALLREIRAGWDGIAGTTAASA
ncbi:MAG: flagellar export chaperone FliS [Pseudomonadota bacterium]